MNSLIYLMMGFCGLSSMIGGYKELRHRRYSTYIRPHIFRKAKRVSVTGNRVIPLAVWHMIAGMILSSSSFIRILQNRPNALGFLFICVFALTFMEVVVGIISIRSLVEESVE